MGLFSKIKNMFKKNDEEEKIERGIIEEKKDEEVLEEQKKTFDEDNSFDISHEDYEDTDLESNDDNEEVEDNEEIEDIKEVEDEINDEKENAQESTKESVKVYEKGLTKSREGFVSKLINLTNRHKKVDDEYFDELEEILIMADIGIDTVMSFMDRLRKRVRKENIEDL